MSRNPWTWSASPLKRLPCSDPEFQAYDDDILEEEAKPTNLQVAMKELRELQNEINELQNPINPTPEDSK